MKTQLESRFWQRLTFPIWFPVLVGCIACAAAWEFGRVCWCEVWG